MTLKEAFDAVLTGYAAARGEPWAKNPMGTVLRRTLPDLLRSVLGRADVRVKGSSGQFAQWAKCPWVAILDPAVTDTAMRGFYPVYLFREDLNGFYLSLNQGVTELSENYEDKTRVKTVLRENAQGYRALLGQPRSFKLIACQHWLQ
jgi:hypothetical protein